MQPRISKQIFGNIIKHIDTHNRIKEEEECWRQHLNSKSFSGCLPTKLNGRREWNGHAHKGNRHSRAYMDDEESTRKCVYMGREDTSNFWMRQFDSVESSMTDRWGHSGFKELYPELFENGSSSNNSKRSRDETYEEEPTSESNPPTKKRKSSGKDRDDFPLEGIQYSREHHKNRKDTVFSKTHQKRHRQKFEDENDKIETMCCTERNSNSYTHSHHPKLKKTNDENHHLTNKLANLNATVYDINSLEKKFKDHKSGKRKYNGIKLSDNSALSAENHRHKNTKLENLDRTDNKSIYPKQKPKKSSRLKNIQNDSPPRKHRHENSKLEIDSFLSEQQKHKKRRHLNIEEYQEKSPSASNSPKFPAESIRKHKHKNHKHKKTKADKFLGNYQ